MHAKDIMTTDVVVCHPQQYVADVVSVLSKQAYRMIPVVDEDRTILGAVHTLSLLNNVVPSYIVTGDLKSIPYAPDLGLMRKHYKRLMGSRIEEVMDREPTIVHADESILSVTAALITYDRFEYAMVADSSERLLGIISSSDILNRLSNTSAESSDDA